MNGTPLYASKRTFKSLWQEYRIYRDRLELQAWVLLHTVVLLWHPGEPHHGQVHLLMSLPSGTMLFFPTTITVIDFTPP